MSFTKVMQDTVKRAGAMSSTPEVAGKGAKIKTKTKSTSVTNKKITSKVRTKLKKVKSELKGALSLVGDK